MEMRVDYPTSKHGSFRLTKASNEGLLLHYHLYPEEFYRISLLRIAADEALLMPYPHERQTMDTKTGTKIGNFNLDFSALPAEACTLYALYCEQLVDGEPAGLLKSKGLRFLFVE